MAAREHLSGQAVGAAARKRLAPGSVQILVCQIPVEDAVGQTPVVLVLRVVALREEQPVAFVTAGRKDDVVVVCHQVSVTKDDTHIPCRRAAVGRQPASAFNCLVRRVLLQNDVDHPGDRIRPIDGRPAAPQNLDSFHGGQRNRVQVDERVRQVLEQAVVRDASAIHKNQRVLLGQAAQSDHGGAWRKAVGKGFVDAVAERRRDRAQVIDHRLLSTALDVLRRDYLDVLHRFRF